MIRFTEEQIKAIQPREWDFAEDAAKMMYRNFNASGIPQQSEEANLVLISITQAHQHLKNAYNVLQEQQEAQKPREQQPVVLEGAFESQVLSSLQQFYAAIYQATRKLDSLSQHVGASARTAFREIESPFPITIEGGSDKERNRMPKIAMEGNIMALSYAMKTMLGNVGSVMQAVAHKQTREFLKSLPRTGQALNP